MSASELGLALLSGLLSTLSPCVLPLLPIVISSAVQAHAWGAVALGVGLALSFTALGLFIATVGISLGLDAALFRTIAGVLMLVFAVMLLVPPLQARFAALASGFSNRGNQLAGRIKGDGLGGQFLLGLVLGAIWTPCVGPTLGAAATLASSGQELGHAAAVMAVFGVGAALPLILLGSLSRQTLLRIRGRLGGAAQTGKKLLGVLFLLIGLGILTGYDHRLEAWLVQHSPAWLAELTTRF
jgi:cytochrome c-type biogenesis protein